jgi:pyocin large subunit-like protein
LRSMRNVMSMWIRVRFRAFAVVSLAMLSACKPGEKRDTVVASTAAAAGQAQSAARTTAQSPAASVRTSVGFRSRHYLDEHFAKHGSEFRGMTKAQYLLAAQTLRDSPVGGDVEEIVRSDGTASRFDKASGSFIAFNRDGTIRTFFKPNDGERYFRRQAQRSH